MLEKDKVIIKMLKKVGMEGIYLKIIKDIYDKLTANLILNSKKLKAFPVRSRIRQRMPVLAVFIQHSIGSFSQIS